MLVLIFDLAGVVYKERLGVEELTFLSCFLATNAIPFFQASWSSFSGDPKGLSDIPYNALRSTKTILYRSCRGSFDSSCIIVFSEYKMHHLLFVVSKEAEGFHSS